MVIIEGISTRFAICRRVVDTKRVALHLHIAEDDGQTQKSIRLDNDRSKVHIIIGNLTCSVLYLVLMCILLYY